MPPPSLDANGLSVGGQRLLIRAGTIPYARVPAELWRSRLHALRRAGLNTVETPIVWAAHEPNPGKASFTGDLNLPAFIQTAADIGLWTILRLGPYIGDEWDRGGLPPWLITRCEGDVRSPNPAFLSETSRFFGVVSRNVRELLASRRSASQKGVIAVQLEHRWECGSDAAGDAYLAEIARFARESGIDVPAIGANNLYTTNESEMSAWCGYSSLHAHARQLRAVLPGQPAYIAHLPLGAPDTWADARRSRKTPSDALRRIAELLSSGAQFNISPFCGGTCFGFTAGRLDGGPERFTTTSHDCDAPLTEAGRTTDKYLALRRICQFASSFEATLSVIDHARTSSAVSPDALTPRVVDEETGETAKAEAARDVSVIECRGSGGSIVYLFAPQTASHATRDTTIVLPDGSELPVTIGRQGVAWLPVNVNVAGRATLDYANICPFAHAGSVLVCFAPAGTEAHVSVNGVPSHFKVPRAAGVHLEEFENLTILAVNEETIDTVWVAESRVYVGAHGLTDRNEPIGTGTCTVYDHDASRSNVDCVPHPAPSPRRITFEQWRTAGCEDHADATNPRYATIDGPARLVDLGVLEGYAWMRFIIRASAARKLTAHLDECADRVHLYRDAQLLRIVGVGPGASHDPIPLALSKGENAFAALIDNLGHFSRGSELDDPKGLFGHLWVTKTLRPGAPKLESADALSPLDHRLPVIGVDESERTDTKRITWKFTHRRRSPIFLSLPALEHVALLVINDNVVRLLTTGGATTIRLDSAVLKAGNNVVQVATLGDAEKLLKSLRTTAAFAEGTECITDKARWGFAKWEHPAKRTFTPIDLAATTGPALAKLKGSPRWWKTTFNVRRADAPYHFDATGLSKGQLFLNGHNVGRYWVASPDNKKVPPQKRYYLPEPWLKTDAPNELLIFDEHGFVPKTCRIEHTTKGAFG